MVRMHLFTCRHGNAPLCWVLKVATQQELILGDFNSVCEKRETILCISIRQGRLKKTLQNRKMRLKLAASLMCLCFLNICILPRDSVLLWYPIFIHMVDSLVPNSGSKLSVQSHSWQYCFLNIFPDPLYCVVFGSMLGFQGECIFKNTEIFLINSALNKCQSYLGASWWAKYTGQCKLSKINFLHF